MKRFIPRINNATLSEKPRAEMEVINHGGYYRASEADKEIQTLRQLLSEAGEWMEEFKSRMEPDFCKEQGVDALLEKINTEGGTE